MFHYHWVEIVLVILTMLSITSVGLLAIWAALGRGHWFVRVAVVGALFSLLLLVPAYKPLIVFVVQAAVAVPILVIARRLRARSEGKSVWQFGLRDLLLLTPVVAAVAAVGAIVPKKMWQSWDIVRWTGTSHGNPAMPPWLYVLILAATMGVVTCLAAWIVLGRCRRWKRLTVLCVAFPAVLMVLGFVFRSDSLWRHQPFLAWASILGSPKIHIDELVFLYAMCSVALMVIWLWLARASVIGWGEGEVEDASKEKKHRWLRWLARAGLLLLSLAILIPLGWAYWIMVTPLPVPETVLPKPNGYTRLVELSKQLQNVTVPDDDPTLPQAQRPTPKDFIDFEQRYHKLFIAVHESLDLRCLVPLRYDASDVNTNLSDLQGIRQLARALYAAGHAACLGGDYEEGVQRHIDTIRLGRSTAKGGLIVHWLVDIAIEGIGLHGIHTEHVQMPAKQRRILIQTIDDLQEGSESFEVVRQRDDAWSENAYGWLGRLVQHVLELSRNNAAINEACRHALHRQETMFRILLVELALENYRDSYGQYPKRLDELVPKQLKKVPLDPFNGKPLRYRLTDKGYLLYGVGSNGQDDGGTTCSDNPPGDDVKFQ